MVMLVSQHNTINKIIQFYRKRDYDNCLILYKKLPKKTIISLSTTHCKLHTTITHYLYKNLFKRKDSIDLFVEYGLTYFSLLSFHQKKEFFYIIYVYIQKCEHLFLKKKLQQKHKDMLSVVIDIFGRSKLFNVSSEGTNVGLSQYTISYKNLSRIVLRIPNYIFQPLNINDFLITTH